jgi:hypothetical protein
MSEFEGTMHTFVATKQHVDEERRHLSVLVFFYTYITPEINYNLFQYSVQ